MIQDIIFNDIRLAIIIRSTFSVEGIKFFSDEKDSQQIGYMKRPIGYEIKPHRHNLVPREVHLTQEVLFIRKGKVRVDFYNDSQEYILSEILAKGDVILLSNGGHGFKMIEESEIIEVKQGPYCGELDKVRFEPVNENLIKIKRDEQL